MKTGQYRKRLGKVGQEKTSLGKESNCTSKRKNLFSPLFGKGRKRGQMKKKKDQVSDYRKPSTDKKQ